MITFNFEHEKKAAIKIAEIMSVAARTAPKSKGIDNICTALVTDNDILKIRNQMKRYGEEKDIPFFVRDFNCTENIYAILLIGVRNNPLGLPDCGYCGFKNCKECKENGANCFFNIVDLGIAVSSAVNSASMLKVDTRIMYSIGRAARDLKILPDEYNVILGIPISVTSKSPFFDRDNP
jgi:uncharacterized ferredoxin-like protein